MSAEYSLEEVRAHARMLRECRINTEATRDRQQDKLADICDAYADLLDRIAADEGAGPGWSAQRAQHPDLGGLWSIRPPSGNNVFVEDGDKSSGAEVLRELAQSLVDKATSGTFACPICGYDKPQRHSGEDVAKHRGAESNAAPEPVAHPPAHAAQAEHQCRSCMAKDYGLQPTAEPVAQGEVVAWRRRHSSGEAAWLGWIYSEAKPKCVASATTQIEPLCRHLAAQPRAVPDGTGEA